MIIIIANVLKIDYASKAALILLVLAISFYYQFTLNPFLSEKLNTFEGQAVLINLLTIYLGIINKTSPNEYFFTLFTAYFFIFNIGFYLFWGYSFILKSVIQRKAAKITTRSSKTT